MRYTRQAEASSRAPEFRITLTAIEVPPKAHRRAGKGTTTPGKRKPQDLAPIRLSQVNRVLDHRYVGRADRDCVAGIIEIVAHLCRAMDGWPDNFRGWVRKHAPTFNAANVAALIDIASAETEPWDGAMAGRVLRLSDLDRQRFRAWAIEPFDLSREEQAETRKLRKREADKARRRKAGAKDRAKSAAKEKPWIAMGISERTHYRRKGLMENGSVSRTAYKDKIKNNVRREFLPPNVPSSATVTTPVMPPGAPSARPALEIAA